MFLLLLLLVASSYIFIFPNILFKDSQYLKIGSLLIGILDGLGIFSGLEKNQLGTLLMVALKLLSGPLS